MMPWRITRNGADVVSFDPGIARALITLLPAGTFEGNRPGSGITKPIEWRDIARAAISLQRSALDGPAEAEKMSALIAELQDRFVIESEEARTRPDPGEREFVLSPINVRRFKFEVALASTPQAYGSAKPFLRDSDELLRRARAHRWLVGHLENNPDETVVLKYPSGWRPNRSFTLEIRRGEVATQLEILPDGNARMYFFSPLTPEPMPKAKVGDVIRPDGTILTPASP
jgi:hypothetical protein